MLRNSIRWINPSITKAWSLKNLGNSGRYIMKWDRLLRYLSQFTKLNSFLEKTLQPFHQRILKNNQIKIQNWQSTVQKIQVSMVRLNPRVVQFLSRKYVIVQSKTWIQNSVLFLSALLTAIRMTWFLKIRRMIKIQRYKPEKFRKTR